MIWQLIGSGLALGGIYGLVAIGYSLTFLPTRIVNFAHGDLVVLGSLLGYSALVVLGLPLPAALMLSATITALATLATEKLAVQRFLQQPHTATWVMSTLGLSLVLRYSSVALWGKSPIAFPDPLSGYRFQVFGAGLYFSEVLSLGVALALALVLQLSLTKTRFGMALRCIAQDPSAAKLMGVPTDRTILAAFGLSGALTGFAGVLVAPIINVSPEMGAVLGLKGFAAAALGGISTPLGAALGGLLLGTSEVVFAGLLWPGFHDVFAFLVLLIVLLLRPQGILSFQQVRKV